jgi:YHS domain-containing protein
MKSMLYSGALALALIGGAAAWAADDHKDHGKKDEKAPTTKPVNKHCAVMTEHPVDERVTIQHEGKTIGFCCEDCIPEFKKDPAKYTKNMK